MPLANDIIQQAVTEGYRIALRREADSGGRENYAYRLARGEMTLKEFLLALYTSGEHDANYGPSEHELHHPDQDLARYYVGNVFQRVLVRNADASGLDTYARLLSDGKASIADVAGELFASQENQDGLHRRSGQPGAPPSERDYPGSDSGADVLEVVRRAVREALGAATTEAAEAASAIRTSLADAEKAAQDAARAARNAITSELDDIGARIHGEAGAVIDRAHSVLDGVKQALIDDATAALQAVKDSIANAEGLVKQQLDSLKDTTLGIAGLPGALLAAFADHLDTPLLAKYNQGWR